MLALLTVDPLAIVAVYPDGIAYVELGDSGMQVSPAEDGWSDHGFRIMAVTPAEIPEGKQIVGSPTYELVDGVPTEIVTLEDIPAVRQKVSKSTVTTRLIEAGLINAAYTALMASPTNFARWIAADQPAVYVDDPDAIALVEGIGGDIAVILAPEDA